MKLLQVPTCIAVIAAPYWILYTKTSLKDNFNNVSLGMRAFGHYIIAVCIKVLIMASGVPEFFGDRIVNETAVMTILNCLVYFALAIVIRGKNTAKVNGANIILASGLGWSLPENIGRLIFEVIRSVKQNDHSERFVYIAMQTNLFVLSSILAAAIFFMWQREQQGHIVYAVMIAIATLISPVASTLNEMQGTEPSIRNFTLLAIQGVLMYLFGLVVRSRYRKTEASSKAA